VHSNDDDGPLGDAVHNPGSMNDNPTLLVLSEKLLRFADTLPLGNNTPSVPRCALYDIDFHVQCCLSICDGERPRIGMMTSSSRIRENGIAI